MEYAKTVKVYKQGGTSITIPVAMCELMGINIGDELNLIFDTEKQEIKMTKANKTYGFDDLPKLYQELLQPAIEVGKLTKDDIRLPDKFVEIVQDGKVYYGLAGEVANEKKHKGEENENS